MFCFTLPNIGSIQAKTGAGGTNSGTARSSIELSKSGRGAREGRKGGVGIANEALTKFCVHCQQFPLPFGRSNVTLHKIHNIHCHTPTSLALHPPLLLLLAVSGFCALSCSWQPTLDTWLDLTVCLYICVCKCIYVCISNPNSHFFFLLFFQHVRLSFFSPPPPLPRPIAACAPTAVKTTYSIMKMSSPRIMQQKRSSKSSNSSRVSMTTSTAEENLIESKLFSWMRLFRFASLLCRAE